MKVYEVRREYSKGWCIFGRFPTRELAEAAASRLQDAVRAKGVFVDVVEVAL